MSDFFAGIPRASETIRTRRENTRQTQLEDLLAAAQQRRGQAQESRAAAQETRTATEFTQQQQGRTEERARETLGLIFEQVRGIPDEQVLPAIEQFKQGNPERQRGADLAIRLIQRSPEAFNRIGETELSKLAASGKTVGQRDFASQAQGLSPEDAAKARRIGLGLDPRAVGSAVQTITATGTAADIAGTEEEIAGAKVRGQEEEKRASELIGRGLLAAESTAVIRRGLELLKTIRTGGPQAVSLRVRSALGIEGADEGELSNSLGKAVLSQLRETFGAQFTVEEGNRLERIEASFNKSVANNTRLLTQTLRISERTARRAIKAAADRGQDDVVADIEDLLTFSLDIEDEAQLSTGKKVGRFTVEVVQ